VRYCGLPSKLNIATLEQLFTLRANDGFVEAFGPALIAEMATIARVSRCVLQQNQKKVRPLREGQVDIEIGVLGEMGPEIRVQALFRDRFIGVVRRSHPCHRRESDNVTI
jgi:DNA-binding transcriptional LysR family regulator